MFRLFQNFRFLFWVRKIPEFLRLVYAPIWREINQIRGEKLNQTGCRYSIFFFYYLTSPLLQICFCGSQTVLPVSPCWYQEEWSLLFLSFPPTRRIHYRLCLMLPAPTQKPKTDTGASAAASSTMNRLDFRTIWIDSGSASILTRTKSFHLLCEHWGSSTPEKDIYCVYVMTCFNVIVSSRVKCSHQTQSTC